jgi:hypothetical protein
MAILDAHHERIMTSLGKTEATNFKGNPDEVKSVTEHQEIPKGEAAVMPLGERRKRLRVCNLAAERLQKRKDMAQENRRSRRKLAATYRKVSLRAEVAWR